MEKSVKNIFAQFRRGAQYRFIVSANYNARIHGKAATGAQTVTVRLMRCMFAAKRIAEVIENAVGSKFDLVA